MKVRVTELTRSINRRCMFHRRVGVIFLGSPSQSSLRGNLAFMPSVMTGQDAEAHIGGRDHQQVQRGGGWKQLPHVMLLCFDFSSEVIFKLTKAAGAPPPHTHTTFSLTTLACPIAGQFLEHSQSNSSGLCRVAVRTHNSHSIGFF